MTGGSVARRYAKALYELGVEAGNVEEIAAALGEIATGVASLGDRELAAGMLNRGARQQLGRALAARIGADSILAKFIQVVALRDRLAVLPAVHHWMVKLQDQAAGRVRMTITAASELDSSEREQLLAVFAQRAGASVVAADKVDPEIVGGAIVELEGRVYDGSVKTRIARLAANMAGETS